MRGRRRKGRGKEGKVRRDWGEKERILSSFLVHAFLPLGSLFRGDCLYSTLVESSDETAQTIVNTTRLTLNCIRNLVPTVLSDPAFSQPRGWLPLTRSGQSGRGPWQRGCYGPPVATQGHNRYLR